MPKLVFAAIGLLVGILFLVLTDPPKTMCSGQIEQFKAAQKNFLFAQSKLNGIKISARYKGDIETCKFAAGMGGCYGLFQSLRGFVREAATIGEQCHAEFAKVDEVKSVVRESLNVMSALAWGGRAPASAHFKKGWFQTGDVLLFCDLEKVATQVFLPDGFSGLRKQILNDLPVIGTISSEEKWKLSLFSHPCPAGTF